MTQYGKISFALFLVVLVLHVVSSSTVKRDTSEVEPQQIDPLQVSRLLWILLLALEIKEPLNS